MADGQPMVNGVGRLRPFSGKVLIGGLGAVRYVSVRITQPMGNRLLPNRRGDTSPRRDDPTLGILIAKSRDKGTIEYALRSNNAPLAVSTYAALPPHVRELMPSAEDLSRIADDILDGDGSAG